MLFKKFILKFFLTFYSKYFKIYGKDAKRVQWIPFCFLYIYIHRYIPTITFAETFENKLQTLWSFTSKYFSVYIFCEQGHSLNHSTMIKLRKCNMESIWFYVHIQILPNVPGTSFRAFLKMWHLIVKLLWSRILSQLFFVFYDVDIFGEYGLDCPSVWVCLVFPPD